MTSISLTEIGVTAGGVTLNHIVLGAITDPGVLFKVS